MVVERYIPDVKAFYSKIHYYLLLDESPAKMKYCTSQKFRRQILNGNFVAVIPAKAGIHFVSCAMRILQDKALMVHLNL